MQLASISLRAIPAADAGRFPFSVPAVANLGTIELTTPVTLFVGENGSGKSTLLEGLAKSLQALRDADTEFHHPAILPDPEPPVADLPSPIPGNDPPA